MRDDTLEVVYIDVHGRASPGLESELRRLSEVVSAKLNDAARDIGSAFDQAGGAASRMAEGAEKAARASGEAAKATEKVGDAATKASQQGESLEDWAGEMRRRLEEMGRSTDLVARETEQFIAQQIRAGQASKSTSLSTRELDEVIKSLGLQVRNTRNAYVQGRIEGDAYKSTTEELKAAINGLLDAQVLSTDQQNKLNAAAATAQRGIDTYSGKASRLGLAQTVGIALQNQFNTALSGMGPAGSAASGALGLMAGAFGALQAPLTMADFSINKLMGGLARLPGLIGLATTALTVAGVAALARLGSAAADAAEKIQVATVRTSLSAEAFQELEYAAGQSGVKVDLLTTTLQRLQRRASDAAAGNAGLKASFDALGVSLRDSEGNLRGTEDLLAQVADGLVGVENSADRIRLAFKIFDTEGAKLLPLLEKGSAGIAELRDRAREMGVVLSGDAVLSLLEFKNELDTLRKQFETTRTEIVAAFIPVLSKGLIPLIQDQIVPRLQALARRLNDLAQRFFDAGGAGEHFRAQLAVIGAGVQSFGQFIYSLGQLSVGLIQVLTAPFAALGNVIGQTTVALEAMRDVYRRILQGDWSAMLESPAQVIRQAGVNMADAINTAMEQGAAGLRNMSDGAQLFFNAFDFAALRSQWTDTLRDFSTGTTSTIRAFKDLEDAAGAAGGAFAAAMNASEGSLAALRQKLAEARQEFENAATQVARDAAMERIRIAEVEIASIEALYVAADPFAAVRRWVTRLSAELEFGLKNAAQVFDIINPRFEELRAEAAAALDEFGVDSQQYQDAVTKLGVIESLLNTISGKERSVTIDVRAAVTDPVPLVMPEVTAGLSNAMQAFVSYLNTEASAGLERFRSDWSDWNRNVGLITHQTEASLRNAATAVGIFGDTLSALIEAGEGTRTVMDAIERNPAFSMVLMTPPGDGIPALGLLGSALKEQAEAWSTVQTAMTKEQLAEAGNRLRAASEEVEGLKRIYEGVDLSITPIAEVTLSPVHVLAQEVERSLASAAASASVFGTESELAAAQVAIFEGAIRRALQMDPGADVSEWASQFVELTAGIDAAAREAQELKRVTDALASAQIQLAELTGAAPTQWDRLRKAFMDAAAAATITTAELDKVMEAIQGLEKAEAAAAALDRLTNALDIGGQITEALSSSLASLRDGGLLGSLSGLTQLGTAIGAAIGGPAVGALVQAIGQGLQAAVGLFSVLRDLFAGESPARRELAESITQTIAGAVRSGIEAGVRGADDWRETLRTGITEAVYGALLDAFMNSAITKAIIQPFIDEFTRVMHRSGQAAAMLFLESNITRVLNEADNAAASLVEIFDRYFKDTPRPPGALPPLVDTSDPTRGVINLPSATVSMMATPAFVQTMTTASDRFLAGTSVLMEAAELIRDTFERGFTLETASTRGVDAARIV